MSASDRLLASVREALALHGIDVLWFATVGQLTNCPEQQDFVAILLEERPDQLESRLGMLRLCVDARTSIVVVGTGGVAAMTDALALGADDYLFADAPAERSAQRIIARVGVKLRHHRRAIIRIGSFEFNAVMGQIESFGARVSLTARETSLARLLFENPGRIVAADRLHVELCGTSDESAARSVKQHVYQLRRKLEQLPSGDDRLRVETVYGAGYRLAR